MKKDEKKFFVENLTEELQEANSVVLVDYSGLNVKAQQDLKKQLKAVGSKMLVVKNTLFKRAGEGAKLPTETFTDSVLTGPIALVISNDDPIAPLQVLGKFASENDLPQLKVGVIEGNFQDNDSIIKLSKLPSKEILVGQAVGAIGAPVYGLLSVLQANMQNLISVLEQAKTKGGE